jgi:hypothetical protein
MKNFKLILNLMLIATSFMFFQCTSDYTPIPGKDGENGIDGEDGADGLDTSAAACIECHSNSHRDPIIAAYLTANHASGGSWARGTSASCAACHNNEGFIDYIETGAVAVGGYGVSNPLNCTGCHSSHRSFDFETDGNDYAVRTLEGVDLRVFAENEALPDYTIDYGNASNLCANCHQPRRGTPTVADYPGKYLQTSGHWGPHHGPQTALLEGLLGAYTTFTLVEDIPAVQQATHRTGSSCVQCHMGGTSDGSQGHTWTPNLAACTSCHETMTQIPDGINGLDVEMETLAALLENVVGQAIDGDNQPIFEADGTTPVPKIGIVIDGHPETGLFDLKDAEAAWNYLFILEDKSGGIHNPAYARAIIRNSIAALQQP